MEYTGQKRSNFLVVGFVWLLISSYILLKAIPYQLPIKPISMLSFYKYSICYFIFILGTLVIACASRDRRLLRAYAGYAVVVLLVLMLREVEIEHELLDKLRNGVVGFFVMPYWGWSRILEDNTQTLVAGWCALSGAVALYGAKLSEPM